MDPALFRMSKRNLKNHIQRQLAENINIPLNNISHANRLINMTNRTQGPKSLKELIKQMEAYRRNVKMSPMNNRTLAGYISIAKHRERMGYRLSNVRRLFKSSV